MRHHRPGLLRLRLTAAAVAISVTTAASGCGYVLHPERRGNHGAISGETLVFDLLWLIPGILPGVVFLIVDFTSGAMYLGGKGKDAVVAGADGNLNVHLPAADKPMQVDVRIVDDRRAILDAVPAHIGPDMAKDATVAMPVTEALRQRVRAGGKVYLEVAAGDAVARLPEPLALKL